MKNRSRIITTVLVVALLLSLLSMNAAATPSGIRVSVYKSSTSVAYYPNASGETVGEVLHNVDSTITDMDDSTNGYWLYTYNGVFGTVGKNQPVNSGDVLAFYLVPAASYSTATFAKLDDTTAIMRDGVLIAKSGLTLKGEVQNFDMSKPYVRDASLTFERYNGSAYTTATTIASDTTAVRISGTNVMTTVIPVTVVSSYAAYEAEVDEMLAKLTATATKENNSTWLSAAQAAAALTDADAKADAVIALGQTIHNATRNPDNRLATASFGAYVNPSVSVDPDIYDYTLVASDGSGVFTNSTLTPVFTTMASGANVAVSANNSASNSGGTWTLQNGTTTFTVTVNSSISYTFAVTKITPASGTTKPDSVGYLPVGQFATGATWGSFYSNGTNVTGTTKKFSTSVNTQSTGVSLGAAGGYIEYDFGNSPIVNSSSTPYGLDFILYGNAFNGNPEAAAVKVYGTVDGTNYAWYHLAGSRYYDKVSLNGVDVTYKKVTSTGGVFTSTGIWYKVTKGNSVKINWTKFSANTAWWPEFNAGSTYGLNTAENYGTVWGSVNDVEWDTTANEIKYKNVCLVIDTDTTNDYQFGYADVHINGTMSSTPVNPYTITNTGSGGDGYDLSWAVDGNGNPVVLKNATKVHVYTAACLNSTGTAFVTPAVFGETSAEMCGIFVVSGSGTGSTTNVQGASLSVTWNNGSLDNPSLASTITSDNTFTVPSDKTITISYASSGNTVFVNNASGAGSTTLQFSLGEGETRIVRVIAKDSTTGLPYIGFMKLRGSESK